MPCCTGPSIMDLSAIVIAIAALGVAVWQTVLTRKHNKLSVRPLLSFFAVQSPSPGEAPVGLSVKNNGVGPAIVTSFRVLVDGKVIETVGQDPWPEALKALNLSGIFVQHHFPLPPDPMAAGQLMPLLTCEIEELKDTRQRTAFFGALNRVRVRIAYESVYREEFSEMSPSLHFRPDVWIPN